MIFSEFQHELSYAAALVNKVPILQFGACLASRSPERMPSWVGAAAAKDSKADAVTINEDAMMVTRQYRSFKSRQHNSATRSGVMV